MTRNDQHRRQIQSILDHLNAPDQIELDDKRGIDPDHMWDAIKHLKRAKKSLRKAEM